MNKYKEAEFYKKLKNKTVHCVLCPHSCVINDEKYGKCRVRKNIGGKLYSMSYEKPVSVSFDPIEKKPLYHFLPGSLSFSIGMVGCNLGCAFCQNWELSQKGADEILARNVKSKEIVKEAKKTGCPSISYTYSEPLVSYEFIMEIAKISRKNKVKNVLVSNGFINPDPLKKIVKYIDAANIDLKSIDEGFYKKICQAKLNPVLETLKILKKNKVWIEITNLIIPGFNDKKTQIKRLVEWIKKNLGTETPIHFTAFYPTYKMKDVNPTNIKKLREARNIASKLGMKYVYTGNLPDDEGNNTYCPKCRKALIIRKGFSVIEKNIKDGKCICGEKIAGVWY